MKEQHDNEVKIHKKQQKPSRAASAGAQSDTQPGAAEAAPTGDHPQAGTPAADLAAALAKAQAEAAEYLDGWQRARAEFANYRKRVEREKEDMRQQAAADMLASLLPIVDDFDRALGNIPAEAEEYTWTQGVVLIVSKLHALLKNSGLTEINPVGEPFDPALHEAVGADNNAEVATGHVTVVLQKGYAYGDRVLRPARVRVAN